MTENTGYLDYALTIDDQLPLTVENYTNVPTTIESTKSNKHDKNTVATLTEKEDDKGLIELLQKRVNNSNFITATINRNRLYDLIREIDGKIKIAKGINADENGTKKTSYITVREQSRLYRDVSEHLSVLNNRLNNYRAINAEAVLNASVIRENREIKDGVFLTYDKNTIGDLVAGGEYESGSPEWHAKRLSGIGGSDVPKIMKSDPKYGAADYRSIIMQKVGLSDGGNNTDDFRDDLTTAVGRGNAWEEGIRHMYADRNPDKNVAFCKTSWEGKGDKSYRHANFDGLELDDNGVPTGIVEIKTGIHAEHWGDTADGYEGIPQNYRKQVIWYGMNAKLKNATVVAVLDDYDYREYKFSMDDPRVVQEWAEMEKSTIEFWEIVNQYRNELAKGIDNVSTKLRKGFPKTLNMKDVASKLSAYSGETFMKTYAQVTREFKKIEKDGSYTREQIQQAITNLYVAHDPSKRNVPLIGIDLETNHASPKQGRIIETAIVKLNNDGSIETMFSSTHGIPEKAAIGVGVGLTDIHRISYDMIEGKAEFGDNETQTTVLELLKSGVLVAHNASFEKEYLIVNLDGFAEALDAGEIQILDTRQLTTQLMLDSKDNSLNSFAEDNGIPYEGAHAALVDTEMMMLGLWNFQKNLHQNGKFVKQLATIDERALAQLAVTKSELVR